MNVFDWNPNPETKAHAIAFLHEPLTEMKNCRKSRPCVVVLPGGGYTFCSAREGEPVAQEYYAGGFNVVLLDAYSINEMATEYRPLCDIGRTIMEIRRNADAWGCDPDAIAVVGFSAGGHLAATAGAMWNDPVLQKKLGAFHGENRPNGMILGYPVIRADELTHGETIRTVSGSEPGTEAYAFWSVDRHVDSETCPAFIWHTVTDPSVPVENSFAMMTALKAHRVPFECHLFPGGGHGMSVCTMETTPDQPDSAYNSRWVEMSLAWLYRQFSFKK